MAEYTNLTSLAGLQVGDVIRYNQNVGDIDLAGFICRFEIRGDHGTVGSYFRSGGYVRGTMTNATALHIRFYHGYNNDIRFAPYFGIADAYGNGTNVNYNRFIVAGNPGTMKSNLGANLISGGLDQRTYTIPRGTAYDGSQTDGGYTYCSENIYTQNRGGFGYGGAAYTSGSKSTFAGGGGWYGGGSGGRSRSDDFYPSSGGSSYVLTTESYKPSGYMTNYDFTLTDTYVLAGGAGYYGFTDPDTGTATNASTRVGGTMCGMITIIRAGFDPTTQTKIITVVNGVEDETIINQGDTITAPEDPIPASPNEYFKGWYEDSNYQTPYVFGGTAGAEFIYLYAKFVVDKECSTFRNSSSMLSQCTLWRWNGTRFEQLQIHYIDNKEVT